MLSIKVYINRAAAIAPYRFHIAPDASGLGIGAQQLIRMRHGFNGESEVGP